MMQQITISGTTGVGKTLYADALERAASKAGYRVMVSDHQLFTNHARFSKQLAEVRRSHEDAHPDVSIIVINDGGPNLEVCFVNGVSHSMASVLFRGAADSSAL